MPCVVFDEESKTGHGFEIKHWQQKYQRRHNVYIHNWWAFQLYIHWMKCDTFCAQHPNLVKLTRGIFFEGESQVLKLRMSGRVKRFQRYREFNCKGDLKKKYTPAYVHLCMHRKRQRFYGTLKLRHVCISRMFHNLHTYIYHMQDKKWDKCTHGTYIFYKSLKLYFWTEFSVIVHIINDF